MIKKWKLLTKKNVSPSKWFPIEKRKYQLPNKRIVDDFFVCTLADSALIIAMTQKKEIVMIKMYKQGVDDIVIQFPAGRMESKHKNTLDVAMLELEEETGIKVKEEELTYLGKLAIQSTKSTEKIHYYFVKNVTFNSKQNLDDNEEIEVITLEPKKIDRYINEGKIWTAPCIAGWTLAKSKIKQLR